MDQVPEQSRYSYIFDGESQLLDTILLSDALNNDITYVNILHVNADFAHTLANDTSERRLPYRSSDHDIPIVFVNLGRDIQQDNQSTSPEPEVVRSLSPVPTQIISETPSPDSGEPADGTGFFLILILAGAMALLGVYLIIRRGQAV
jgi:hypothetical protein